MPPIYVTKSFLPPYEEYCEQIKKIWEGSQLTNQGPMLLELEEKITKFLGVKHFHFLTNGTLALQLALSALNINDGEIITTPFSYVATTSSILWQRCTPIFVDIEPNNFTIDANKIEEAITPKTKAILGVHVFGYACDVDKIQAIAEKHNIKVIYDGAHAFGSKYKGKSLLDYGDISTLSFHATKLFHTIEGGGCIVKDATANKQLDLQKRFGHEGDEHICLGLNAKASEFQAAMGLVNFPYFSKIMCERKRISEIYNNMLGEAVQRPKLQDSLEYNYAYYPVIFESEKKLLQCIKTLNAENIFPRRYFYPSLNTLRYVSGETCPVSESVVRRIACLPLYPNLDDAIVQNISNIVRKGVK